MGVFDDALASTEAYYTAVSAALDLVRAAWEAEIVPRAEEMALIEGDDDRGAFVVALQASALGIEYMPEGMSVDAEAAFLVRGKRIRAEAVRRIVQRYRSIVGEKARVTRDGELGLGLVQEARALVQSGEYIESNWVLLAVVGVHTSKSAFEGGWEPAAGDRTLLMQALSFVTNNAESMRVVLLASENYSITGVISRQSQAAINWLREL